MNPLAFLITAVAFFWLGILIQRYYAMKRLNLFSSIVDSLEEMFLNAEKELYSFRRERADAERLLARELTKRKKS